MRSRRWLAAAAGIAAAAQAAGATTLTVTITGQSDTAYELDVSGIQKNGRLGAAPGAATVRDLVDIGRREAVKAVVTFTGAAGVIATCPALEIKLRSAQAACEPAFVLTERQAGTDAFACESRCEPKKRVEKSSSDDEDEDDWVYALNAPAPAAPRLDGWAAAARDNQMSPAFYTASMSAGSGAGLYSPAGSAQSANP